MPGWLGAIFAASDLLQGATLSSGSGRNSPSSLRGSGGLSQNAPGVDHSDALVPTRSSSRTSATLSIALTSSPVQSSCTTPMQRMPLSIASTQHWQSLVSTTLRAGSGALSHSLGLDPKPSLPPKPDGKTSSCWRTCVKEHSRPNTCTRASPHLPRRPAASCSPPSSQLPTATAAPSLIASSAIRQTSASTGDATSRHSISSTFRIISTVGDRGRTVLRGAAGGKRCAAARGQGDASVQATVSAASVSDLRRVGGRAGMVELSVSAERRSN
mmetsp:Transcript_12522/g.31727  ORF Transcript_12522/g.31727 Transcript_12522/m.31727 type:complete len:271 (-) Transcript_12522:137-949(-)